MNSGRNPDRRRDPAETASPSWAREISHDYQGEDLHLICILRGGVMFLTDLMRNITCPNTIDFMAVSSYGSSPPDHRAGAHHPGS